MNRPMLLLICDFLLLSMFALARFDVPPDAVVVDPQSLLDNSAGTQSIESGLLQTLRESLDSERSEKLKIQQRLQDTQSQLSETAGSLTSLQNQYASIQENLDRLSSQKAATEEEAANLESALSQTRQRLESIQSLSQTEQVKLQAELQKRERDLIVQETRLKEVQLNLKQKEEQLNSAIREQAALEQRLVDMENATDRTLREKQALEEKALQLSNRNQLLGSTIEVLKTEKQMIASNLADTRQILDSERQKNTELQNQTLMLTANVATLASKSEEISNDIKAEIRRNTILSPHEVFNQCTANQVYVRFEYLTSGLVGGKNEKELLIPAVLFRLPESQITWTVFHISDSPLDVRYRVSVPDQLSLWLQFNTTAIAMNQIAFHPTDPTIVMAPVSIPQDYLAAAPVAFDVPENPFQYDEAIIIQPTEQTYGISRFSIVPGISNLIRLQEGGVLSTLLGSFNAKRGNLVFSRGGDFLGLMRNGNESLLMSELTPNNPIPVGRAWNPAEARQILESVF